MPDDRSVIAPPKIVTAIAAQRQGTLARFEDHISELAFWSPLKRKASAEFANHLVEKLVRS
jgi:hypothetical protein